MRWLNGESQKNVSPLTDAVTDHIGCMQLDLDLGVGSAQLCVYLHGGGHQGLHLMVFQS